MLKFANDGFPLKFVKKLIPQSISSLSYIINQCLQFSMYHNMWKFAVVVHAAKNTKHVTSIDFRPIGNYHLLSKICES